ncbi:MAG: hypothetical protein V4572_12045 [Bacteroidota bacterium]
MSNHATVTKYIIDLFDSDNLVNTVAYGSLDDKYLGKNDVYPLVHITPTEASYEDNSFVKYTYEIAVVDIRYFGNNFSNKDEIFKDNLIDNLNTTDHIIRNFITTVRSGNTSDEIYLEMISTLSPVLFQDVHLLDGWFFTVEFVVPNDYSVC